MRYLLVVLIAVALAGCSGAETTPTQIEPSVGRRTLVTARDICGGAGIEKVREAYGGMPGTSKRAIASVAAAFGARYREPFRVYAATGCAIGLRDAP